MTNPAAAEAASAPNPHTTNEDQPDGFGLWAVLRRDPSRPVELDGGDAARAVQQLEEIAASVEAEGVTIRGFYDTSGMRADADLMIWIHGEVPETLQWALRQLRRSELLKNLLPTWNAMGVHRGAEFNKQHIPAFLRGIDPKPWLVIYPFVRSYEWYLLPGEERSRMLSEHGRKGASHRTVLANTVSAFALGDYEWLLPMEADELHDLVDLMRDLRATDARRHVREEVPFYTGRRIEIAEVPEVLQ
jgi:chlorite dismutase